MVTRKMKQKLANGTEMEVDIGALAENVLEDENHRFVTDAEKEAFLNASGGAGKAKYASDLREATGAAFYYWREDTVGNPYSAGLADCSCGFAVVYGDDQDGYTILASGQGPLDDHLYLGTSTGKTDDIQWTKVPMASDITNAINAKVKWTIYSRVTDIGLTAAACTIQTIDSALPNYSVIEFPAFKTDYKVFSFGGAGARHKLKIVKGVDGYSYAEDMDLTNNVMYIASKAASDAEWSQWRAIEGHEVVAASPAFDFNQCTFNGTRKYALSSSPISAALNKPATAPGILTSTKIGSYIVQDYLTTGGIRYTRSFNGSAWTAWQELDIASLKKSVADGKKLVADAVSGKGITTAADAAFATIAANIGKIIKATGNATAAQVLSGKTFSNASGSGTGTMPDKRGTPQKINYWRINNNRFEVAVDKGYYEAAWDADCYEYMEFANVASCLSLTAAKLLKGQTVCGVVGTATGDANATAADIAKGKTAYVGGSKITGTLAVNSALSFSIAAVSSTEIEIYWTNPTKGPFSGVFVQMSTSGYPGATGGTRKYTGIGTNSAAGGKSSCKITGLSPDTKYYFTVVSYCTGLGNGNVVNLTATTQKAQGTKVITSSGTFTVPAGVTSLDIFCVGGGGGGNHIFGTSDETSAICGGGGGGHVQTLSPIAVTPGESLSITIGAGGTGNKSGSFGQDGGDSGVYRGTTKLISAQGGYCPNANKYTPAGGDGGSGGGAGGGSSRYDVYPLRGYAGNGGSNGSAGNSGVLTRHDEEEEYSRTYSGGTGSGKSTRAFGDASGTLYAGGGAGCFLTWDRGADATAPSGGAGGGGNGGIKRNTNPIAPTAGTANTGGGGGGGYESTLPAGKGGSGVVIIRWGYA